MRRLLLVLFVALAACGTTPSHLTTAAANTTVPSPGYAAGTAAAHKEQWYAAAARNDWYAVAHWNEAVAARRVVRTALPVRRPVTGNGRCGGSLPSCSVMMCESGGSLTAQNPLSTASGKWQILDSTWGGYGGYRSASDAPEDVQDARAQEIYADGAGRSQWVC